MNLGDLTIKIIDNRGKTPPLANKGIELIETTSLTGNNKFPDYSLVQKYVSQDTYDTWFRAGHPAKGDILVATVGANIGSVSIMKDARGCVAQNLVGLRLDKEKVDPDYLYYFLSWSRTRQQLKSLDIGAAQPSLKVPHLLNVDIPLPSIEIQRESSGILSAYDELIENNQRRIKILEEMARSLYREWFVHFRFPGHDKVKMVPSPLGSIPQGWEVTRVGRVLKTLLGGTPSRAKAEYWQNGTVPWINSGKVNELRIIEPSEFITELALEKSAAKLMPRGTTVLAITGATLGQVSYLEIDTTANQSVVGITDEAGRFSEWLYLMFKERIHEIILHASGGAQQHINKEIVSDVQILIPPTKLADRFKYFVEPPFRQLATLMFKKQNLRRTRDLLLPRLLSGQADLSKGSA